MRNGLLYHRRMATTSQWATVRDEDIVSIGAVNGIYVVDFWTPEGDPIILGRHASKLDAENQAAAVIGAVRSYMRLALDS